MGTAVWISRQAAELGGRYRQEADAQRVREAQQAYAATVAAEVMAARLKLNTATIADQEEQLAIMAARLINLDASYEAFRGEAFMWTALGVAAASGIGVLIGRSIPAILALLGA